MHAMPVMLPLAMPLPDAASAAVGIVRELRGAGHAAVLAGGCVRDLLLGQAPHDYDVATDAPPERLCELFPRARQVGVQFGVVLVKRRGRWIEVATFRSDGPYVDGRRPVSITLSDAEHDARRRDFTVNGMFLDPLAGTVIDYVGGLADVRAGLIRAIGDPAARFSEDYLRLVRAARFAARLGFTIEPQTAAAVRAQAPQLALVAAERVREELERMLALPSRARAWDLLGDLGLRPFLWPGARWSDTQARRVRTLLARLPAEAPFELALAVLLADAEPGEVERVARALTLSNAQRATVAWLVKHQADLDDPQAPTLAQFKRLMAQAAFPLLADWARARHADLPDGAARSAALAARVAAIPPERVHPPPLVTGDDLIARRVAPGPLYARVLEALYTAQLDEQLQTREAALAALEQRLAAERGPE